MILHSVFWRRINDEIEIDNDYNRLQREDNLMFDVGGNSGIDSESISVKATMFGKGNGRIGHILDNA